jgi:Bacteriocin-protection, YdeI or OmpD-Associated/Domain of unknown function (DUF1905)
MNKATRGMKKNDRGPSVFRFSARLVRGSESPTAPAILLNVPKPVSEKLRGTTTVEGTINGQPFRAALESDTTGGRRLRVSAAMRRGAGADIGDRVKLAILGPEPAPIIPADLAIAFSTSPTAKSLWKELASLARRDWIRWIDAAKTPETRARRVTRTVEQLSSGKRRPCCVNVYEFMLSRVQE